MSTEPKNFYEFGSFRVDPEKLLLLRDNQPVALPPKAFETLLVLVRHSETVVLKDDLMKSIWPDTFVEESNLAQNIFVLRKALGDMTGEKRYIATVPGRGYRFAEKVRVVSDREEIVVQSRSVTTVVIEKESPPDQVRPNRAWRWVGMAAVAVAASLGGNWYWQSHRPPKLTDQDTIVLADFANSTGDAIFDDTLKTALSISLRQSPFLNVLPDSVVVKTLKLMTRPAGTKLTPEVALDLCQRAGSKAYIAGAIGSLGSEYVLRLKAVNCRSGDTLVEEQVTAASKEKVLDALGESASKLRGELGESLASVQKFDVPLRQATTSSLEALKAYSVLSDPSRVHTLRAIELDPNFAMAYLSVGIGYASEGDDARASEYLAKAFQLREHTSEWEKLFIAMSYYRGVTGELDKASEAGQQMNESYPWQKLDGDLGQVYMDQGEYEKAAEVTRQGMRLDPQGASNRAIYSNLAEDALGLQRLGETHQIIQEAEGRKAANSILHLCHYALAFLQADATAMSEQQHWFVGKPIESAMLELASDTEAYGGHLRQQRELTRRAVDAAIRADSKESAGIFLAIAAQREAVFGNPSEARRTAAEASKFAPTSPGVESESALASALAGDAARAGSLAKDLDKRFPLHTQMQSIWLPAIRAHLALDRKDPVLALKSVHMASPIELGEIEFVPNLSCLYSVYARGEAYLAAGRGNAAAAEFQRIIDHSGIVWNCWTGALAHLGVARANALQSRTSQGRMPMPPASGHLQPTTISSHSGKTPTPTSQS